MGDKKTRARQQVFIIAILFFLIIMPFVLLFISRNKPATETVDKTDGSSVQIVATPAPFNGEPVQITGQVVCLPHKKTSGPQTLECAYGLKTEKEEYYGLRDSDPEMKHISMINMETTINITGKVINETNEIYQTKGIIQIDSFTKEESPLQE